MNTLFRVCTPMLLCAAIVLILAAHLRQEGGPTLPQWQLQREAPLQVTLAEVTRGNLRHVVEASGKVEAEVEVKLSAEVSGRIAELPVREGDRVKGNQLLVQLDLALFEADVRSGEARVQRLKESITMGEADLEKARRDFERNQRLFSRQAVDQVTFDDSATIYKKEKARLNMTRHELVEAESGLSKSREDLRKATIRSPLSGVVSQLSAKQGEVVLVGTMNNPGTVIMTLSDPGSLVVRARIDESKVARVQSGQKALIHLQSDSPLRLTGVVKHVSPKGSKAGGLAGAATGGTDVTTFEVLIQIDAPPPQVRMEMTANVEILVAEHEQVLTIPAQAVLLRRLRDLPRSLRPMAESESGDEPATRDPSRRYYQVVYVEAEGRASCRLVKTGIGDRGRVGILDGLRPGERIVTGPYRSFEKLRDGKPITELTETDAAEDGNP
jgi:HlyD family secretion protein